MERYRNERENWEKIQENEKWESRYDFSLIVTHIFGKKLRRMINIIIFQDDSSQLFLPSKSSVHFFKGQSLSLSNTDELLIISMNMKTKYNFGYFTAYAS